MGEGFIDDPDFYFALHRRVADLGCRWSAVNGSPAPRIICYGNGPWVGATVGFDA
jgi:hypothetical protein